MPYHKGHKAGKKKMKRKAVKRKRIVRRKRK